MQYDTSNNSPHISVKVCFFLHTLLVRLFFLVTTLMISLPFNSYLQGVKIAEGCFWIRGISASVAQEHSMWSTFGASLTPIKCSLYLSQGGGKFKALSSRKAKKPKNKRWKSLVDLLWWFSHFSPCFLFACTGNGQLNSESFLGFLSLELGIKLGDISDFHVLPTDFFEETSRQAEKGQMVDEGYFCYETLSIGFFLQKLFLLLKGYLITDVIKNWAALSIYMRL